VAALDAPASVVGASADMLPLQPPPRY
jgi:hypothetical protein